jgi:streptogramin lyase
MNKTLTKTISAVASLFIVVLIVTGCNKSSVTPGVVPVITTTPVFTDVTGTNAYSGGFITATLTSGVTAYGVCWSSSNQNPTISDSKTADTVTLVSYASKAASLSPKTTYYLRAYATNSTGTGYGNVIQFTTNADLSTATGTVTTFAGNASEGFINGTGTSAFFNSPQGITIDASGNFYIADSYNSAIRKITSAAVVTTLTGNGAIGYVDGTLANAQFYAPQSLVTDASGNIYVADLGNNIIRKIATDGTVSTFAGSGAAGYANGTGTSASFNNPRGLAIDASGNLYVADRGNNLIRKITSAGVVTTFAGSTTGGYIDNTTATSAQFNSPSGIVIDASGNIYVADLLNRAIRKITSAGVVSTLIGGPKQKTVVGSPSAIALDAKGNLFVTDSSTGRVLQLNTNNVVLSLAGSATTAGFADGQGANALFNSPQGIVADGSGNVWIADAGNNSIRKLVLPASE